MNNKSAQIYYDKMAKKIESPLDTRNKAMDSSEYDATFVKKYADKNKVLLDLGAGTGLLINHLDRDFKKIIAIEKYLEFSKFIKKNSTIEIINQDILEYEIQENVNVVTLFGVMSYFNRNEARQIYQTLYDSEKFMGTLIIKNQFGLNEDVVISGWSEELQSEYFAEYRHIDAEVEMLKEIGFKNINVFDIYPSEMNRWDNTHFYALCCEK